MKTYKYSLPVLLLLSALALTGCREKETGSGGEINMTIPLSEKNPLNINIMEPKDTVIRLNVAVDKGSSGNVLANMKVSRELVEAFNEANGTSYLPLSEDAYSFDKNQVILPRYNISSSNVNLTLRSGKLSDTEKYLLPVTVTDIRGDENIVVPDDGSAVAYILFSKKEVPKPRIMSGKDGDDPLAHWEVVYVSSERADGTSGWGRYAIDNDNATHWHHNYGQSPAHVAPFEFIIDMKRTVKVYGVQLRARTHPAGSETLQNTGVVSWCDVGVAENVTLPITSIGDIREGEYKGKTTFRSDVLKWQSENNPYLSDITEGRYLRLTVWRSYNGGNPDAYNGVGLGEIRVWGRFPEDGDD